MTKAQAQERLQKLFHLSIALGQYSVAQEQYASKMADVARRNAQLHPMDVPCDAALYVWDRQQLHMQREHIQHLSRELGFDTDLPTDEAVRAAMRVLESEHNVALSFAPERDVVLKKLHL